MMKGTFWCHQRLLRQTLDQAPSDMSMLMLDALTAALLPSPSFSPKGGSGGSGDQKTTWQRVSFVQQKIGLQGFFSNMLQKQGQDQTTESKEYFRSETADKKISDGCLSCNCGLETTHLTPTCANVYYSKKNNGTNTGFVNKNRQTINCFDNI